MDVLLNPVIRYWDLESSKIALILQEIAASGGTSVAAWVPWDHLEQDKRHLLQHFLRQAFRFNLQVSLGISPELGTGYRNGGIPNELLLNSENLAKDRTGQVIYACGPPNIHPLVNLTTPEVFQRFGHYLLRLSDEITDVMEEYFQSKLRLVVSDSLFKHYFTFGLPPEDFGDFSALFQQKQLDRSRAWNPARAERLFRSRASDFLRSRFQRFDNISIQDCSCYQPSSSLDRLILELSGAKIPVQKYYQEIINSRKAFDIIWHEDLSSYSQKDAAFLISSSQILFGEQWLRVEDFLAQSKGFRQKMTGLTQTLSEEQYSYDRPVLAIVQNRFAPARLTKALEAKLRLALQTKSFIADVAETDLKQIEMMVVEEALAIEYRQFQELLQMAKEAKKTIALFRSSLCERTLNDLACLEKFTIRHGWNYEVFLFESGGHLIVIEGKADASISMDDLASRLLAVANIYQRCEIDTKELSTVQMSINNNKETNLLFLLNHLTSELKLNLSFTEQVELEGINAQSETDEERCSAIASKFSTKLPARAVVPVRLNYCPKKARHLENEAATNALEKRSSLDESTSPTQLL